MILPLSVVRIVQEERLRCNQIECVRKSTVKGDCLRDADEGRKGQFDRRSAGEEEKRAKAREESQRGASQVDDHPSLSLWETVPLSLTDSRWPHLFPGENRRDPLSTC